MNFYKTHDPFNSKKVFLFFFLDCRPLPRVLCGSRLKRGTTSCPMWFKSTARKKEKQEEAEDLLRIELEQMTLLQWVLYRLNAGRRRRD